MSVRLTSAQPQDMMTIGGPTYSGARVAWIAWETEPDIVKHLLPEGLTMVDPIAVAFIKEYPKVNMFQLYCESALFLRVQGGSGVKGIYCLSMPITD